MRERVQATGLLSVPMGAIVTRTSSPERRVKASGGTTPVPVMRKQPLGSEVSRNRNSASD